MARSLHKRSGGSADGDADMFGDGAVQRDGVGASLRAERERQGLELAQLAARLKIRRLHLASIENERFDLVPPGTYAVSFIRTYAAALGLDPAEMVRRYRQTIDGDEARTALVLPTPLTESRLPSGIVIAAAVAVAALGYATWALLGPERMALPRVETVPPQLQAAAPPPPPPAAPPPEPASAPAPSSPPMSVSPTVPAAQTQVAASPTSAPSVPTAATGGGAPPPRGVPPAVVQTPAVSPPPPAAPPLAASPGAPQPAPPQPVPAQPVPAPPPPPVQASQAQPAAVPPQAPSPPPAAEQTRGRVAVVALGESWVQVKDGAGTIVFMRILKAGDVYQVPARRGLLLTTGNAGSIEIRVDGRAVPVLGQGGRVRRDVPLDPESLLEAGVRSGG